MIGASRIDSGVASFLESGDKVLNGTGLVKINIIPASEHFQEGPLRPLVVSGIASADLAVPIIGETDPVHLLAVAVYILHGRDLRMLACLDGILLCGKSKGVITHGMEDIEALQSLVPGENVTGDITQGMPYM